MAGQQRRAGPAALRGYSLICNLLFVQVSGITWARPLSERVVEAGVLKTAAVSSFFGQGWEPRDPGSRGLGSSEASLPNSYRVAAPGASSRSCTLRQLGS